MGNGQTVKSPNQVLSDLLQSSEVHDIKYLAVLYKTDKSSQIVIKSAQDSIVVQGLIHEAGRTVDKFLDGN